MEIGRFTSVPVGFSQPFDRIEGEIINIFSGNQKPIA